MVMGQLAIVEKRLRVSCELVNTQNSRVVWSESFDRELTDVFDIQDQIARAVTHQLSRNFGDFEYKRVSAKRMDDLNAWELLHRAMYYGWTYDWLVDSIALLEKSIQMDETLAESHALLAARLAYMIWYGDMEKVARSMKHAQRALALEPESSVCLLCSSVAYNVNGQSDIALRQVEHALEINPNLADAWAYNGLYLGTVGRSDEALEMLAYAIELSPKDPIRYLWYAHQVICYANKGDYELALEACQRSTTIHNDWFWTHMAQAQCEAMLRKQAEARLSWSRAKELNPIVSIESMTMWLKKSALNGEQQFNVVKNLKEAGCT
jgi:tetratricopeptide (TPR) repeat protein